MARNQLRHYLLAFAPPRNRRVMKKKKGKKEERGRRKGGKKASLLRSTSVKNAISVFTRCLRVSYVAKRVLELYFPLPSRPPLQVLYIIDNRTLIGLSIMGPIDTIDRVLSFRHGGL